MGSRKYPNENHYDAFVTAHGGSCNAFTEGEYTTYHFDIESQYFSEALDIFAQCFISPLLSVEAVEREIKAINSEFQLAKGDDESRVQQLLCHGAIHRHVLKKFSWGNAKVIPIFSNSFALLCMNDLNFNVAILVHRACRQSQSRKGWKSSRHCEASAISTIYQAI